MQVEVRQRLARSPRSERAPRKRIHQLPQRLLDFQDHMRGAFGDKRRVTAELDRIAKALLGVEQNGLAGDLVRSKPQRLREIPLAAS